MATPTSSAPSTPMRAESTAGKPTADRSAMDKPSVAGPGDDVRQVEILLVGLALFIGVFATFVLLRALGGDPITLAAVGGSEEQIMPYVEEVLGREVDGRPGGHDGQQFLLQAWDPLYIDTEHAFHLDRPIYRAQRMLFPLIAGVGGLVPNHLVPWTMTITNILALAWGTLGTSRLARAMGVTPMAGAAFLISPAILSSFSIASAGILTLAAAIWATLAMEEGQTRRASGYFLLAVLSREVMLLYLAGVALLHMIRTRKLPIGLVAPSVIGVGAWAAYIRIRLASGSGVDEVREFDWPFKGVVEAIPRWSDNFVSENIIMGVVLLGLLAFVWLLFCRPSSYLGWGTAGFSMLALVLSVAVWHHSYDISRAMLPMFTAIVLMALAKSPGRTAQSSSLL